MERFWNKVALSRDSGCWEWIGARQKTDSYGVFKLGGRALLAHRVAYEWVVGPIPDGLELDHLCRNRRCVNPGHLEPVTQAENGRRGYSLPAVNARKTHCVNGHPLGGNNLVPDRGKRACRTCKQARDRAWSKATRERRVS